MQLVFEGDCHIYSLSLPYRHGGVNVFFTEDGNGLTMIDAGIDSEESWNMVTDALKKMGRSPGDIDRVLITHHHSDHIGLLHRLLEIRDIPVFAHPAAIANMRFDSDAQRKRIEFFQNLYREMGCGELGEMWIERMRQSANENARIRVTGEIRPLMPDRVPSDVRLEPIWSPGHAHSHLMFYDRGRKVLFCGDHVLPNINTNALVEPDESGGRRKTLVMYYHSLRTCREIEADLALPGHGNPFRNFRQTVEQRIAHIDQKLRRMQALLSDRPVTAFELARMYYPQEYKRQFSLVMSSVIGTLDFLECEGRAVKFFKEGIWHYMSA